MRRNLFRWLARLWAGASAASVVVALALPAYGQVSGGVGGTSGTATTPSTGQATSGGQTVGGTATRTGDATTDAARSATSDTTRAARSATTDTTQAARSATGSQFQGNQLQDSRFQSQSQDNRFQDSRFQDSQRPQGTTDRFQGIRSTQEANRFRDPDVNIRNQFQDSDRFQDSRTQFQDSRDAAQEQFRDARETARDTFQQGRDRFTDTMRDTRGPDRDTRAAARDEFRDARETARDIRAEGRDQFQESFRDAREEFQDARRDDQFDRDTRQQFSDDRFDRDARFDQDRRLSDRDEQFDRDQRMTDRDFRDDRDRQFTERDERLRDTRMDSRSTTQFDASDGGFDARSSTQFDVSSVRAPDLGLWLDASAQGQGLLIRDIADQGAITRWGFREGDQILFVNGQRVAREADFVRTLFDPRWRDQQVEVIVWRQGQQVPIWVQPSLLVREYASFQADPLQQYGLVIDDRYPNYVVVQRVFPRSPAFYAGLRPGDVIVNFQGQRIASPQQFTSLIQRADADQLALDIQRNQQLRRVQLAAEAQSRTALRPDVDTQFDSRTQFDTRTQLDSRFDGGVDVQTRQLQPGTFQQPSTWQQQPGAWQQPGIGVQGTVQPGFQGGVQPGFQGGVQAGGPVRGAVRGAFGR